ncbi:MAG: hypothetical protein ABI863_23290, partial [Ginsengibacter sp.]
WRRNKIPRRHAWRLYKIPQRHAWRLYEIPDAMHGVSTKCPGDMHGIAAKYQTHVRRRNHIISDTPCMAPFKINVAHHQHGSKIGILVRGIVFYYHLNDFK